MKILSTRTATREVYYAAGEREGYLIWTSKKGERRGQGRNITWGLRTWKDKLSPGEVLELKFKKLVTYFLSSFFSRGTGGEKGSPTCPPNTRLRDEYCSQARGSCEIQGRESNLLLNFSASGGTTVREIEDGFQRKIINLFRVLMGELGKEKQ